MPHTNTHKPKHVKIHRTYWLHKCPYFKKCWILC